MPQTATLLQPYQSAAELLSPEAIADAIDRATSQINSCVVAARCLGIADVDGLLTDAWLNTYRAEMILRALPNDQPA